MGSHLFTSVACGGPQWHPHMLFPVISTGFPQASQQVSPTAQEVPEGFPANFNGPIPTGSFPGSSASTPECGFQKVLLAAPYRWFPELCRCPRGTASLAGTQWATCQRFPWYPASCLDCSTPNRPWLVLPREAWISAPGGPSSRLVPPSGERLRPWH